MPRMPLTVPATAPPVPPTTAPTGPAACAPASAPSAAPRTVPCACAATGSAMIAARVAAARLFVFIGRSKTVEDDRQAGDLSLNNPEKQQKKPTKFPLE